MKKPFLFDTVNFLYHKAINYAPKFFQERSMGSAFILGYGGSYLLIDLVQKTSEVLMSNEFNTAYLPILEKICIALTIATPVVYSFIKPKEMQEIVKEHPTYTSGMIGAGLGAIHSTLENLI